MTKRRIESPIWLTGVPYEGYVRDAETGLFERKVRLYDAQVLTINIESKTMRVRLFQNGIKSFVDAHDISSEYFFEQMTIQPIPKQGKLL